MAKTSKLTKILQGIKHAQDILDALDAVVDVDRLIGISNAQGPLAKGIRSALSGEIDRLESEHQSSKPVLKQTRKRLSTKGG